MDQGTQRKDIKIGLEVATGQKDNLGIKEFGMPLIASRIALSKQF
ncbi:MAG: hypothetical protein AAF388_04685 [Bacteroidota bacterium]